MSFIVAFFGSLLVNNVVLSGTKGLCSYLGVSSNKKTATGMGLALTVVSILSGLICWGLSYLTALIGVTFMNTIIFILVIASFVQLLEIFIKKFVPSLYKSLGIYLPLITTNCVVLGVALSVAYTGGEAVSVGTTLGTIIGTPLGYFLVIYVFSAIQEKIQNNPLVPRGFKGPAIGLICTAGMALAFLGLSGMMG